MVSDRTTAGQFKDKADKLRAFAREDECPETKKALLSVAESYDRLSGQHLVNAGANRTWRR